MPCSVEDVDQLSKLAQSRLLPQILANGRFAFSSIFIADSPRATIPDQGQLQFHKSGEWRDTLTKRQGVGVVSLYSYVKQVSDGAARVLLSKLLDPSDLTRDRIIHPSAAQELIESGLSTIPDNLTKRMMSPRERADALLRHAMANAHDRQN
jgi:hypothetical protein